ncbi:MAG: hypothetical protein HC786_09335, partial [Richelia sp. CSU_2_1]|nr:hypothetical protein [Richelia sp. CSU_2_1]
ETKQDVIKIQERLSKLESAIKSLRRKKEEGRRKKEEGRRKREEGRRKKEEGRENNEVRFFHFPFSHSPTLPLSPSLPLLFSRVEAENSRGC